MTSYKEKHPKMLKMLSVHRIKCNFWFQIVNVLALVINLSLPSLAETIVNV